MVKIKRVDVLIGIWNNSKKLNIKNITVNKLYFCWIDFDRK